MVDIEPISSKNFSKFEGLIGIFKNNFSNQNIWLGASINNFHAGILLASKDTDNHDICDINTLFVPEPLRREGIASLLLETLIDKCIQKGYKELLFNSVVNEKSIFEIDSFLKNYNFTPLKIVSHTYIFDDLDSILKNKNIQRAISQTITPPKGIDILPLEKVEPVLIDKIKKEANIKYPDYYAIFPTDISKDLKHVNTFVAIANNAEIIGWLTGLDVYGLNIFYKTFYVDKKYRDLGIGYYLINFCVKNHYLKYKEIPAMCGISLKNPFAEKFNSTFFNGVKKSITYEFISKKNIFH